MRIFPIVTATLVCVALYFAILDRDSLIRVAGWFGGGDATSEPAPETADDAEMAGTSGADDEGLVHVTVRRSTAQAAENAVVLRGRTEAVRQVTVAAETSGRIVSEPLRAGASVTEGQLLCEIAPGTRAADLAEAEARVPEARARLTEAEASLVAAGIDARAATSLSESGFASETRAATATASLASAEAAVEAAAAGARAAEAAVMRAREEIARLSIAAPFDGLLETDTAELGSLMQPGTACATVIQMDPIKLVGFVPEAQVDRIELGARAGARLSTGTEAVGEVTFVSRSADPQTRTFRVEVVVANADQAIRDGQSADILVETPGTPAHLLPASAMTLNDDGTLGVRVVVDGIVEFLPVTMLRDTARGVWLAGLPDEVDVITVGQEFVTAGVRVRVTYEELTQ